MSRTGPAYVESEPELLDDLDLKRETGEISEETAQAFLDLYEFAKEIGDDTTIGGAKNANFQLKVDAHQGDYQNDPSVFTANVNGDLQIWPAKMAIDNDAQDSVPWDEQDYIDYENAFQSLNGVPPGATTIEFEKAVSRTSLDEFKEIVDDFVSTCRQKQQ